MEPREIDLFLKASRQYRHARRAALVVAGIAFVGIVFLLAGVDSGPFWGVVLGVLFGAVCGGSVALVGANIVTRRQLLDLIETQINRDPAALQYVKDHEARI